MKKILTLILLGLSIAAPLFGKVALNEDFTSYATGAIPDNPNDGNPHNWEFSGPMQLVIKDDGGRKILNIKKEDDETNRFLKRGFDQGENKNLVLDLELRLNAQTEASDYMIFLNDSSNLKFGGPVKIRIGENRRISVYHGDSGEYVTSSKSLEYNEWYQITAHVDFEKQTYSVKVQSLENPSEIFEKSDLPFVENSAFCDNFLIRPTSGSDSIRTAIDWDIRKLTITTEP